MIQAQPPQTDQQKLLPFECAPRRRPPWPWVQCVCCDQDFCDWLYDRENELCRFCHGAICDDSCALCFG